MENEFNIVVSGKVWRDIKEFCDYNNIKLQDFVEEATFDKFYIFKYGDLNEKLAPKKKEEAITEPPTEAPTETPTEEVVKKKVGRPKKVKVEVEVTEAPKPKKKRRVIIPN